MIRAINFLFVGLSLITIIQVNPAKAQFGMPTDRPTFFNDGQRMMEEEIRRLQQPNSSSDLLTVDDGKLSWQKFISRQGGFSVWLPEGVKSEEIVVLDTATGELSFEVIASHPEEESYRFIVAYAEAEEVTNTEIFLASIRDGLINETNFELVNEESKSLKEYSGKELVMKQGEEIITFRIYVVGLKVYVLGVSQTEANQLNEEINNFFGSFQLLE